MAGKRSYDDGCAVAQALDLVGERWAMLVIRELMFVPKRFSELKSDLPGIATNMLAQRLVDLEAGGLLVKRPLPEPQRGAVYDLTDWGRDIAPVFKVMGRWAARSPQLNRELPMSVNAVVLSLPSHFKPRKSKSLSAVIALHLPGQDFTVSLGDRKLDIAAGAPETADVVVTADQSALFQALFHAQSPSQAEGLNITGDAQIFDAFAKCFEMPDPIAPGPEGSEPGR